MNQVAAEAKKLIALRNTAGKAFNMASWAVAMHHTMEFRFKKEFRNEIGLQKYFAWKRTWHTEIGKQSPACKPEGSEEYEAWRDVTPQCQPEGSEEYEAWLEATIEAIPACKPKGSEEYEAWRKKQLEGHQKRLKKRMAEPLPDTVVAAQQAEAKQMAAKKSAATVIEENKSARADLKCKSCGESGHGSRKSFDCKNFVAPRPPTCGNCGETGHRTHYCRS